MIKAVLFDVDGVLIDSFEPNLIFYSEILKRAGYPTPTREKFMSVFPLTMLDAIKELTNSTSEEEINKIFEMAKTQINYPYHLLN